MVRCGCPRKVTGYTHDGELGAGKGLGVLLGSGEGVGVGMRRYPQCRSRAEVSRARLGAG